MAIKSNVITEQLIFHSDRGSQYASYKFTNIIKSYNGLVKQSMSRKGNCWDNAVAESFFKSLKVEWIYEHNYSLNLKQSYLFFNGSKHGIIDEEYTPLWGIKLLKIIGERC